MSDPRRGSRLRAAVFSAAIASLALAVLPAVASAERSGRADAKKNFDSRTAPAAEKVLKARAAKLAAQPSAATTALSDSLGAQGVLQVDPLTSTPRNVGKLDGFLTSASRSSASSVALGYVRTNAAAFGLSSSVIDNLTLVRDYVSIDGTHHLYWQQSVNGIPVFGNGLRANVTKDGQLINVLGSPVANLAASSTSPGISAAAADAAARSDVGAAVVPAASETANDARHTTTFTNGDRASLVLFQTTSGLRLGWLTQTEDYGHVIDAQTGAVLYKHGFVDSFSAQVLDYYPNAANGGTRHPVTLDQWLQANPTDLRGPNVRVYSDVNDDNIATSAAELTPLDGTGNFDYAFTEFHPAACVAGFPCSWDPETPFSWQTNKDQSATQLFYFINKFHDHLAAAPIGFTPAAGNFEDNDRVRGENLDGASTDTGTNAGLPDGAHIDNANFSTPPDGFSPRMQMFLFHQPHTAFPNVDPFIASNGSDEADVVYHENTHGLSNRLVVDSDGFSTLTGPQSRAMGEAWSDWYAMDFLNNQGYQPDTAANGEVRIGNYVGWGNDLIRFEPMDCAIGASASVCPGGFFSGTGGFTYGDFGKVAGGPEVHSDGEIWGQTLWQLRSQLGSTITENLVTRAMELSPGNPSFLDMRNAILQADLVASGGANSNTVWSVFANRGMGYFAGVVNGDDTAPVEDFSVFPSGAKTAKLQGVVTDSDSGALIQGATVAVGGHDSGFPDDLVGASNGEGFYQIKKMFLGTYPKVIAGKPGYDSVVAPVAIVKGENIRNFSIRRDWASFFGDAAVTDFNGPDYSEFGCGPTGAIDQSLGSGWGSDADLDTTTKLSTVPKYIVVKLPQAVNITTFAVDPNATCGDGQSASTKDYKIETSTDGTSWVVSNQGSFPSNRSANGHLNPLAPAAGTGGNVRYVKFTMLAPNLLSSQNCPGPFSGCDFMDMTELEVYGTPAG